MDEQNIVEESVSVELDGEGVEPDTIDARSTLELASAYFDLLVRAARNRGSGLQLVGLKIMNKCMMISTVPSSVDIAREAADEIEDYLTGREEPIGVQQAVQRLRAVHRMLPERIRTQVIIGRQRRELVVAPGDANVPPWASISLRVTPIRIGGSKPRVRFRSKSEETEFSLDATEEQAREIGASLYREIDIEATVWRDADDRIRGGRLEEFDVFTEEKSDVRSVFQKWLNENAPQWADIDDIEAELERG